MKRIIAITVALLGSSVAMANETTTTNGATVAFSGNRATVCEVRNYENNVQFGALGELGAATPVTDTASIYCNVRFNASINSQNGFLKLNTLVGDAQPTSQSNHQAQGYSGFNSALDYSVNVTGLGTANTSLIGSNTNSPLGNNLDPINASATLTYNTVPGGNPLLGGNYNDTVTLTLTPVAF
jgi:spore coat protein U-like protein